MGFSANACLILVTVWKKEEKEKNKSGGMMDVLHDWFWGVCAQSSLYMYINICNFRVLRLEIQLLVLICYFG